ncbi:hypothetical protein Tco_0109107 [Tanacetum coccineum]
MIACQLAAEDAHSESTHSRAESLQVDAKDGVRKAQEAIHFSAKQIHKLKPNIKKLSKGVKMSTIPIIVKSPEESVLLLLTPDLERKSDKQNRMLDHGMEVEDESETAIILIHLFILWTTEDGDDS